MKLYTIGFTQKKAQCFFGLIREHEIELLVDIRLNHKSQLAGFAKGDDLPFFLSALCSCDYQHCPEFAPDKETLNDYRAKRITWETYTERFLALMQERAAHDLFWERFANRERLCLLCSEPTPEHCHRRLVAELAAVDAPVDVEIVHL